MDIKERIQAQINEYPALLYMKGTPQFPQCGFSSRVVTIMKRIGQPFAYINVLEEPEIRENVKHVSDWPTFPQLFISGELIGGCDIIEQLDEQGELEPMLTGLNWPEPEED